MARKVDCLGGNVILFDGSFCRFLAACRGEEYSGDSRGKSLYIFIILVLVNNAIIGLLMEAFRVTVGVIGRKSAGYPSFFHVGIISDMSFRETSVFDKKNFYTQKQYRDGHNYYGE